MARTLFAFAALLLACAAFAAPAPQPFVSGWGKPVDPNRDCKIRHNNSALIIEMPGSNHDYDPIRERFNATRLFRDLEGNFDLQIRVRIDSHPAVPSTIRGQPSLVSAGFLLIFPAISRTTCIRLELGVSQQGTGLDGYSKSPTLPWPQRESRKTIGEDGFVALKDCYCKHKQPDLTWDRGRQEQFHAIWDRGWKDWPLPKKTDSAYLRLEQQGQWIIFFMGPDGENWTKVYEQPRLPAKSKVGFAAYSSSSKPSKVQFDRLSLTRPQRKNPQRKDQLFETSTVQVRRL